MKRRHSLLRQFYVFAYTSKTCHERIVTLVGGEPLLHPDFMEIINFLTGPHYDEKIQSEVRALDQNRASSVRVLHDLAARYEHIINVPLVVK